MPDWGIASDAELVAASIAGDRSAFAMIYDRYADRLFDFCVGMLCDRDSAADCVHEAYCTAAVHLPELREPDKLRPWLYAVARNEALRVIRKRDRERATEDMPDVASDRPGPETLAARSELANLVAQAAGGLSDRDQSVLELTYRHGLDGPELAEALGVSAASAKKMTQRMRTTVERSLGALLVSRRLSENPDRCPELAAILSGWDGRFTMLIRKRVSRHIESCTTCDRERRRLVNPVALLGGAPVFVPAPAELRERTLQRVVLPPSPQNAGADRAAGHLRLLAGLVGVAAIVAALVVTIGHRPDGHVPVEPVNVTSTRPASTSTLPLIGGPPPLIGGPSPADTLPSTASTTTPSAARQPAPAPPPPNPTPPPSTATTHAPSAPAATTTPPTPTTTMVTSRPPSSTSRPSSPVTEEVTPLRPPTTPPDSGTTGEPGTTVVRTPRQLPTLTIVTTTRDFY
ncbi:RNA polymerase sigma factor [Mycolicibacterium xanthum]|uniref:RNA polymerase sigma factor n=1 Tax=Mycolicibacterium xanthum TaxID=2796469 RepID=UPI002106973D|nr:sigma-70 family RNA polymerase sigma factor [Mycolicibacterium xanthum]